MQTPNTAEQMESTPTRGDKPYHVISNDDGTYTVVSAHDTFRAKCYSSTDAKLFASAPARVEQNDRYREALQGLMKHFVGDRSSANLHGEAGIACDKARAALGLAGGVEMQPTGTKPPLAVVDALREALESAERDLDAFDAGVYPDKECLANRIYLFSAALRSAGIEG